MKIELNVLGTANADGTLHEILAGRPDLQQMHLLNVKVVTTFSTQQGVGLIGSADGKNFLPLIIGTPVGARVYGEDIKRKLHLFKLTCSLQSAVIVDPDTPLGWPTI